MKLVIRLGNKEKERKVNQSKQEEDDEEDYEEYNSYESYTEDEQEDLTEEDEGGEEDQIPKKQTRRKTQQVGHKRRNRSESSNESPPSKRRRRNSTQNQIETPSRRISTRQRNTTQFSSSPPVSTTASSSSPKIEETEHSTTETKVTRPRGRGRYTTKNRSIHKSELYDIISKIKDSDTNQIFWYPVSEEEVPNYRKFIRHPMDISTIEKKLGRSRYSNLKAFMHDVNTMFKNAMSFNPEETIYYQEAVRLKKFAQDLVKDYTQEAKVVSKRKAREERRRKGTESTNKEDNLNKEKQSSSEKILSPFHTKCIHVIDALSSEDRHNLFYNSADNDSPEYRKIVKHPMDFATLRRKVEDGDLNTKRSFKDNLYLIFNNVTKFYPPSTFQHNEAVRLKSLATKIMSEFDRPLDPTLQIQAAQPHDEVVKTEPQQNQELETTESITTEKSDEMVVSSHPEEEEDDDEETEDEKEKEDEREKEILNNKLKDLLDVMEYEDKESIFKYPVDEEIAPGYYDVIKHPMDFSKIRKNIENGEYKSLKDMHNHLELTFNNAKKFNPRSTIFYKEAVRLQKLAREIVRSNDPYSYAVERFPEREKQTEQQKDTKSKPKKDSEKKKDTSQSKKKVVKLSTVLRDLLHEFMEFDKMEIFHQPVDTNEVTDYLDYITNPMDFSTMEKKLDNGEYKKINAFKRDFELICENAKTYNPKSSVYYKKADELWKFGKPKIDSIAARTRPNPKTRQRQQQAAASITSPVSSGGTEKTGISSTATSSQTADQFSSATTATPSLEAPPTATAAISPRNTPSTDVTPSQQSVSANNVAETMKYNESGVNQLSSQFLQSGVASSMTPSPQEMTAAGGAMSGFGGIVPPTTPQSSQSFNAAAIIAAQQQQQQQQEREREQQQQKQQQQEQEQEQQYMQETSQPMVSSPSSSSSSSRRRREENTRKRKYVKSGMYKRGRDGNFIVKDPKLRAAGVKMAHTIFKTTGINHAPVSQVFKSSSDGQSQQQLQQQPQPQPQPQAQPQPQQILPPTPPPQQPQQQESQQSQIQPQPQQFQQPQQTPQPPFTPTTPRSLGAGTSPIGMFDVSGSNDTSMMMPPSTPPPPPNMMPFISPPPQPPQTNTSKTTVLSSQFTHVQRSLYSSYLTDISPMSKNRFDLIKTSNLNEMYESLLTGDKNEISLREYIDQVRKKGEERKQQQKTSHVNNDSISKEDKPSDEETKEFNNNSNNNDKDDFDNKRNNNDANNNNGQDDENDDEYKHSMFDDIIDVIGMGIDPSRDIALSTCSSSNPESEISVDDILANIEDEYNINNNNNNNNNTDNTGADNDNNSNSIPQLSASEFNDFTTNILFNTI